MSSKKMDLKYILNERSSPKRAKSNLGKSSAQSHERTSSGSSQGSARQQMDEGLGVTCPHCPLKYSQRGNLNKHIQSVHKNLRPHQCKECKQSFAFSDGLRRHVGLLHSKSNEAKRPFKCDSCSATFTHRSHLSKHNNANHKKRK